MVKELDQFYEDRKKNINEIGKDKDLMNLSTEFMHRSGVYKYAYNFDWFGRPIIQFPQDIVACKNCFLKLNQLFILRLV